MAKQINTSNFEETDELFEKIIHYPIKNINQKYLSFDNETMELFVTLSSIDNNNKDFTDVEKACKKEIGLYNLIQMRLQAFDFILTPPTILFLCFISETPGKAIIYLHYIQIVLKKLSKYGISDISEITMSTIGMRIFPNGFPNDEFLHNIFDTQKYENGNLVDIATPYQSNKR